MHTVRRFHQVLQDAETTLTRWFDGARTGDWDAAQGAVRRGIPRPHLWWLLGYCLLLAVQISPWWYTTKDGGVYLTVSRNLIHGDAEIPAGSIASVVPPGYPRLISPAFYLGDRPFLAISVVHWVLGVAFVFGVYFWVRQLDANAAVLMTGLSSLNAGLWFHYRRTLKEIAFIAMIVWLVLLQERLRRLGDTSATGPRWVPRLKQLCLLLISATLMVAIALTRYSGILFAAGFGLALLTDVWQRRTSFRRAVVLTLCVGVPASLAILDQLSEQRQQFSQHGGASYEQAFHQAAERGAEQASSAAAGWVSSITRVTIPGMLKTELRGWRDPGIAIFVPVLLLVSWGWWQLVRRRRDIWALTLPLYILLYMAWPFDQGARFAVPLIPILVVCHWMALKALRPVLRYPVTIASVSLALHALVAVGYWIAVDAPRAYAAHQQWPVVDELVAEIDEGNVQAWNVPSSLTVMAQHSLKRLILNTESDRLLVSQSADWVILPAADIPVEGFRERKRSGGFVLYERVAEPHAAGAMTAEAPPGTSTR